jgi:hypothetical protein
MHSLTLKVVPLPRGGGRSSRMKETKKAPSPEIEMKERLGKLKRERRVLQKKKKIEDTES